jgi:hypothetical protein
VGVFNIRALASSYVKRGLQPDSLRRQLNRQGISTAGLNIRSLYVDAQAEAGNERLLSDQGATFVPRPGEGMITREAKEPWKNRYVVRVNFLDPDTETLSSTFLSINTNTDYSKGRAEREVARYAAFLAAEGGQSDVVAGATIESTELVNAYFNA